MPTIGAGGIAIERKPIHDIGLQSTIYLGEVPVWATQELPELYQSCYSILEYFDIYDGAKTMSTCVLSDPRHIVLFSVRGRTAVVMNQLFDIDAESAARVVRSIFKHVGQAKRVRFSGSRLDFAKLPFASRVLETTCDVVIPLPRTYEEYLAGLGRATRHKLRNYPKNFAKAYPDHEFRVFTSGMIDEGLVHRVVEMNRQRMASKGEVSLYSDSTEAQLAAFLRGGSGFATAVLVNGQIVAGTLGSCLGRQRYLHVQSFDDAYAAHHLGWVSMVLTLSECVRQGTTRLHLLWGKSDYKMRLGGVEEHVRAACVYRSRPWRLLFVDDVWRGVRWSWRRGPLASRRARVLGRLGKILRRTA
jgi:hypothetical protein